MTAFPIIAFMMMMQATNPMTPERMSPTEITLPRNPERPTRAQTCDEAQARLAEAERGSSLLSKKKNQQVLRQAKAQAGAGTVYTLRAGQTAQATLSTVGDADWYRVNLVAGQTYTAAMIREGATVEGVSDTYLTVRNANGTVIAANDDGGPGSSSLVTFTATTSGTYYLDASAFSPADVGEYGLSLTAGRDASYDVQMAAGALLRPELSWSSAPGTGVNVTWSVSTSNAGQTDASGSPTQFIEPSAVQISAVSSCLAQFASVCNVTFTRLNPGGTSNQGTIRVNAYDSGTDGAGAYATFPGTTAPSDVAGDISLNNDSVSPTSISRGDYSYFAVMHELGHAMGLDHPGDYNAAPGVDITYAGSAQFIQDSQQYTVMSYFNASATHANVDGYPDGLLLFDIYALQQLYGVDTTTRTGNTTYGFHSNAGGMFDFTKNDDPFFAIWDAGGKDTLDFSGFNRTQRIDLGDGQFSSVGGFSNNISIAYGAVIENAIGGSGNDVIKGNAANNVLDGRNGADKLFGGAGNDTYVLAASNDSVSDSSGVDLITSTVTRSLGNYKAIENLTLLGSGNINGTGNALNNKLIGNGGANTLSGSAGNDVLAGGAGNDKLIGGAGDDVFLFNRLANAKTNVDTITDFQVGHDIIQLDDAVFKAFGHRGDISSDWFLRSTGTAARDANDFLIYETDTGNLYYDSNGNRAGGSVLVAQLDDHLSLTFRDFLIGFGENVVPRNDDGSVQYDISSIFAGGLNFGGQNYTSIYVNTNGSISFANGISQYTPTGITAGSTPMIAPFWADVDTRTDGAPDSSPIYVDLDDVNKVMTITWSQVGYFSTHADVTNSFQLQLYDRGNGNFDVVFRYQDINWTTGDASGGSGGLGGQPGRAGFTQGNGSAYFELPQAGDQSALLNLESTAGNTGVPGLWSFAIRNGNFEGDITFASGSFSDPGLFGVVADFAGQIGAIDPHGDVWINESNSVQQQAAYGNTGWQTYLHELGHALGLHHPNEAPLSSEPRNNNQWTVMSYNPHPGQANVPDPYAAYPLTPMVLDIQAIQALYGANMSTYAGDTSYISGVGAQFALQNGGTIDGRAAIFTIWDAGGVDVINASNQTSAVSIDLNPGAYSQIGSIAANIGLAAAVVRDGVVVNYIENAIGGRGDDRLVGNAGNNILDGGAGRDVLKGGAGDDTYVLSNGQDVVADSSGTDTITSTITRSLASATAIENLVLLTSSNLNGTGNRLNNTITGNDGKNILDGAAGNDTLIGGKGNDILIGGAGRDYFVFDSLLNARTNADTVRDFSVRDDTIELDNAIFRAFGSNGFVANSMFVQNTTGTARDSNDHLIYETDTGNLYYDSNGSRAGGSVLFAHLEDNLSLTFRDFLIV
eukprot:g19994.t1